MICKNCNGTGLENPTLVCKECTGTGKVMDADIEKVMDSDQVEEESFIEDSGENGEAPVVAEEVAE